MRALARELGQRGRGAFVLPEQGCREDTEHQHHGTAEHHQDDDLDPTWVACSAAAHCGRAQTLSQPQQA